MEQFIKDLEVKTKAFLDSLRTELAGIRTNRPTPQLVEDIQVDYLGQLLKVKQLGSISVQPPREIQITLWDKNSAVTVAKAIEGSSLKLTPDVRGNIIRLKLPPLTEERRQELIKVVRGGAEKWRIKLRNLRDEINKRIVQAADTKIMSEDQKFKSKDKVQEIIDKTNKEIDNLVNNKIKEISE